MKDATNPNPNARPGIIQGALPCVAQMGNDGVVRMLPNAIAFGCTEPFFIVRPSYAGRTIAERDDRIRRPSFHQFDMNFAKFVRVHGGIRVQVRVEVFNLLNTAVYSSRNYGNTALNSDFGQINKGTTAQSNFPRQIQLGVKVIF